MNVPALGAGDLRRAGNSLLPSLQRSARMVERNLIVYKHVWMVIFSGFFEPLFYLLAIGIGLGGMVPDVQGISYRAFLAPGLLATSCMNGAISDGFFNVFFKLRYQKTYEGILATPMRVADIAFGEMLWAVFRGSLYAAGFLFVILILGEASGTPMILSRWAYLAWPAAVLVSASFAGFALCLSSLVKKIQGFDVVMGLIVMPMFLFNGTFFPVSQFPRVFQWIVGALPLYHAVELLRQLTTGAVRASIVLHIGYLVAFGAAGLWIALYRLERSLIR